MTNIAKQFFNLEAGSEVTDGTRVYRVSHLLSTDLVLAIDLASNESHRLAVETLHLVSGETGSTEVDIGSHTDRELLGFSDKEWEVAQQRLQAIKPLLENPLRTKQEAQFIAKQQDVNVGTLYRWLATYTNAGHVSALVPSKRGRKTGTTMLDEPIEAIMRSVIEDVYLDKQRRSPQEVIEEMQRRCRIARITPPHANTIRSRIRQISPQERLRRRGHREEATNRYTAIRGQFPDADSPFSVVQIDHTPADVIVVDEAHRKPIGRPYLTLAIDVHSRMIAGFYLSLDPPSSASVGLCLAQAMCPKREYLAELGVAGSWPVWGRIATVHCDNAKEFRGIVLERGCAEHGINLAWRPVKVPRYGGHVERMMGTLAREFHKLPGTTFSDPKSRKGYDSMMKASLTLRELERHIAEFLVNVYHQRIHSELGMSPLKKWEGGLTGDSTRPGLGLMPLPQDPARIVLDFMPYVERTVQPYGLQIDEITYYDPILDPYINSAHPGKAGIKRTFIVRRDPRDISRVYFFDPVDQRYCVIPYRNIGHPPMSLYELKEIRRSLLEEGRRNVDEHLIFEALDKMRTRVEEATHKSKTARRTAQRSPGRSTQSASKRPSKPLSQPSSLPSTATLPIAIDDDPFAMPIRPFEELALTR